MSEFTSILLSEDDRAALREASALLETLVDEADGESADPRVMRAAWLAGRLAGLAGRPTEVSP